MKIRIIKSKIRESSHKEEIKIKTKHGTNLTCGCNCETLVLDFFVNSD